MPLSANSVVFLEMTILAESGVTFFEHEKKVRAHFYCIPALCACISTMFKHFLCAFLLFPSTFFRAHPYCIPALPARISTMIQHFSVCITLGWSGWSGSFLGWSDNAPALLCVHFYFAPAFFVCVFPLWSNTFSLRVFLLCSSIFCACISTLLFQWHSSHPCPNAFHRLKKTWDYHA